MNQENTTKSNSENGKFFDIASSKSCFDSSVLSELRFKKHSSCCKDSHLMIQSNLCITTTLGTKFLRSLETGGRYKEDLCITPKTIDSDI